MRGGGRIATSVICIQGRFLLLWARKTKQSSKAANFTLLEFFLQFPIQNSKTTLNFTSYKDKKKFSLKIQKINFLIGPIYQVRSGHTHSLTAVGALGYLPPPSPVLCHPHADRHRLSDPNSHISAPVPPRST